MYTVCLACMKEQVSLGYQQSVDFSGLFGGGKLFFLEIQIVMNKLQISSLVFFVKEKHIAPCMHRKERYNTHTKTNLQFL